MGGWVCVSGCVGVWGCVRVCGGVWVCVGVCGCVWVRERERNFGSDGGAGKDWGGRPVSSGPGPQNQAGHIMPIKSL